MMLAAVLSSTILAAQVGLGVGQPASSPPANPAQAAGFIETLREKKLQLPIDGFNVESIKGSFYQGRGTAYMHRAADFMAARGTAVHAVDDGTVARLFLSKAGGNTIYQLDPTGRFVYYYAHLDSYASGLANGQPIRRGQVIGYVGSTGDADGNAPHLHLAIWSPATPKSFWDGLTIDPYEVFRNAVGAGK